MCIRFGSGQAAQSSTPRYGPWSFRSATVIRRLDSEVQGNSILKSGPAICFEERDIWMPKFAIVCESVYVNLFSAHVAIASCTLRKYMISQIVSNREFGNAGNSASTKNFLVWEKLPRSCIRHTYSFWYDTKTGLEYSDLKPPPCRYVHYEFWFRKGQRRHQHSLVRENACFLFAVLSHIGSQLCRVDQTSPHPLHHSWPVGALQSFTALH